MSKRKEYLKDLREKDVEALRQDLKAARESLFKLRFRNATSELENTSAIRATRRNIARIETLISQKQGA